MDNLKIGIVGCGWAGERHAKAYFSIEDIEVLAVADIDEKKAKGLATRWAVKAWYKDYRKLLKDPKIDAVSICVPHYFCLLYTSPSPRDLSTSRMPSSA